MRPHDKIKLLSIPFLLLMLFFTYNAWANGDYYGFMETLMKFINPIATVCLICAYFILKRLKLFLYITLAIVAVALLSNTWVILKILMGTMAGAKSLHILFCIPLALYGFYFYYELFD